MADNFASATRPLQATPVHARTVGASRGVDWWSEGWRLFTPAVGAWILIVIVGLLLNLLLALIPILGGIASHLLFPILVGGLMLGCRAIDRGEPLTVAHLFAGFGPKAGSLLIVGLIYIAATIAILLVVAVIVIAFFGVAIVTHMSSGWESLSDGAAMGGVALVILVALLLFLLLYLPVVMAVWFAPALVVLRGVDPWEAMKLSFIGSVRNILPILV